MSSWIFTQLATQQSVRSTGSKIYPPLSHFEHLISRLKTPALAPSPTLILRPYGCYNNASLWCHFISTPLFLTQTSRVWKNKALNLISLILNSCNV